MANPNSHLQHGTSRHTPADPNWAAWDHAWTKHLPVLTGRTDLRVVVAPGAGGGAPACFYPDTHRIEVDAALLGAPDVADPRRAAHKKFVPTAYGALVHEAAHAAHSRWRTPAGTAPVIAQVAAMLEESRAEHHQRARRRGDRRWLRHMVTHLVAPDDAPIDDLWHAGIVAALLLARVDARILTSKDVRAPRTAALHILGRQRLSELRQIWREAHTVDDTDATTMIDLAWRWCRTLNVDPLRHPDPPTPDPGAFAGALAAAIAGYLAAAHGVSLSEHLQQQISDRHGAPATWTRRDPTAGEQHAARQLASRLRQARTRSLEQASVPSAIPPGRLRTRHAITADAQRQAGQLPTAQPWQRRTALPPRKPTLHLGVLVDVSGSMGGYRRAMSSAGWILANGARRTDAITTTIAFGSTATLLTAPRRRPIHVLEMGSGGGTTAFTTAVKLADQLLDLRRRTSIRMLAVVSDGDLADPQPAQKLITTLHGTGCAVLWLHPAGMRTRTFEHTTAVTVADPVEAIAVIADAAVNALATA